MALGRWLECVWLHNSVFGFSRASICRTEGASILGRSNVYTPSSCPGAFKLHLFPDCLVSARKAYFLIVQLKDQVYHQHHPVKHSQREGRVCFDAMADRPGEVNQSQRRFGAGLADQGRPQRTKSNGLTMGIHLSTRRVSLDGVASTKAKSD